MSTARRTTQGLRLAFVLASCAAAGPLAAQLVSARPTSVSLTVVVPPRAQSDGDVASEGAVALLTATPTGIDVETTVRLANRAASRIEVRLAPTWNSDSGRVWIRNQRGDFETLSRGGAAVAMDAPSTAVGSPMPLRFRVESTRSLGRTSLTVPLEFRVMVGGGDEFSIWSFPSLLRVDPYRAGPAQSLGPTSR